MKCRTLIVIALFITQLCSCATKEERSINQLRQFTSNLQQKSTNFSDEDWQHSIDEYEIIVTSLENGRFTDAERREIGKLKGQCTAIYSQYAIEIFQIELKNAATEFEGAIEGFLETFKYPSGED